MEGVTIAPSAICEPGAEIGPGTKIWHFTHVVAGARIGSGSSVGQGCYVAATAWIGDGVRIQNHVSVFDGVVLEDDVFCGPGVVFTNVQRPRSRFPRKPGYVTTRVGRGASIGANATIVCGCTLGEHCLVGAGAVVARDVPPFALVVGVPARRVGWVSLRGESLEFDADGLAICPIGGERYRVGARGVELADEP